MCVALAAGALFANVVSVSMLIGETLDDAALERPGKTRKAGSMSQRRGSWRARRAAGVGLGGQRGLGQSSVLHLWCC